jgi:hypothetical protein
MIKRAVLWDDAHDAGDSEDEITEKQQQQLERPFLCGVGHKLMQVEGTKGTTVPHSFRLCQRRLLPGAQRGHVTGGDLW